MPPLKRGSLSLLPNLALDLLCQIFSFLRPSDLLALARTTKHLRAFLLHSSVASIWRSARQSIIGLPGPPPDMNEVEYASLVFGSKCHYEGCDRKACDIVWHLRIRSCAKCRSRHQPIKLEQNADYIAIRAMTIGYPQNPPQFIPCGPFLNSKGKPIKGFQASDVRSLKEDLKALPPSERHAYLDRRTQETEIIHRFAIAGVDWQLQVRSERDTEMRIKREARAETIRSLVATDFKEEIAYFGWDRIRKLPFINSTQEIKDPVGVLDQLGDYMSAWRELRMEEQVYSHRRKIFLDAWFQYTLAIFYFAPASSPYLPLPPNATVGFYQGIDSIIRQPTPISDHLLKQQLYTAFPLACQYISEWHRSVRRELASLLSDYNPDDNDEVIFSKLKLATSIFQCTVVRTCRVGTRALTYPEILFHPCFSFSAPENRPSSDPRIIARQKARLAMDGGPWNCSGRVQVHPRQYVVTNVLTCYRKDPKSTTATELDMQDSRLVCLVCAARDRIIRYLPWRRAVQHDMVFHSNTTLEHSWLVSNQPRLQVAAPLDQQSLSSTLVGTLGDYSVCLRCPPRIPSWSTRYGNAHLMNHVKEKHGVTSPVFGQDYMYDTNITPLYLHPVLTSC